MGFISIAKFINSIEQDAWLCLFCKGPQESLYFAEKLSLAPSYALCEQPFAAWIVAILRPHVKLAIPIQEVHKFQLQAAITMDHIWFSKNQLQKFLRPVTRQKQETWG
ncbi:hypothetical protein FH972_006404 [Carpinus fangiana]|uniref:Uncharacterized protein n=1 Tax=Carpinus fangiana TaxID=176857 RepID=A0A5N6QT62_9ROSI|nr:hypothetical protein FH972_006404 [Carpinus fangiana]